MANAASNSSPASEAALYAVGAIAVIALATGLELIFPSLFQRALYYPFMAGVMFIALRAGTRPALFALALANVAIVLAFRVDDSNKLTSLAAFDAFSIAMAWLVGTSQRERERLRLGRVRQVETLANSAPVMVWVSGIDKRRTFFNEQWLAFTGRKMEEEIGDGWAEGVHADDLPRCLEVYTRSFDAREPFRMEYRLRRADGAYRWIADSGVPRFDPQGVFEGYIGACIDVHDIRTAHEDRQRLAGRLDNIISSVPGVVWEAWGQPDRANQRIDFVSEHVTGMLGYSVEEWLSTPNFWLKIVHPDDQEAAARNAAAHFARGGTATNEFRWMAKDGRAISVEAYSRVITDADGKPIGMRGVTLDISARKRAEEGLRFLSRLSEVLSSSVEYQQTVIAAARLALPLLGDMCMIDIVEEDGSLRSVAAVHTNPAKQPLATRLGEIPPHKDRSLKLGVAQSGQPLLMNTIAESDVAQHSAGDEAARLALEIGVGSVMIVPMIARDRVLGVVGLSAPQHNRYDQTDLELAMLFARRVALAVESQRLYRAAIEANRAKDDFLATVSHELRTPMTATLGWVRMLSLGDLDDDTQKVALEAIDRGTRAQARLIDDIFDVSSIISGKFRLDMGTVDLPTAIRNAVETLRPAAAAKDITLTLQTDDGSDVVRGDTNRLQQVVWNLVSNAIKFSRPRGHVRVSMQRVDGMARITVQDDGRGIDSAFLPHVFERLRQAEPASTRSGLGLGLAIVRHLVELHGGNVRAESDGLDRGATFIVELPLGAHSESDPGARPRREQPRL